MKRATENENERESVTFICVWVSVYSENKQSTKRRTQNVAKIEREREKKRENNNKADDNKMKRKSDDR